MSTPTTPDSKDTDLENELHAMFYRAILEWRDQGRSEEQIHAINNFNTGVGVKLRKELAALVARREALQIEKLNDELSAAKENLKYHEEKTKNENLIRGWKGTVFGIELCVAALTTEATQAEKGANMATQSNQEENR